MPSANGSALLDNVYRNFFWRTGYELVIAEREAAGGRRCIRRVGAQTFVLGYKALQALGYGLRILVRLLFGGRHCDAPPQRKVFGPRMKAGGVRFLAIGVEYAFDQLVE